MARALITTVPFGQRNQRPLELLKEANIAYAINPLNKKLTHDELASIISDYDYLSLRGQEPMRVLGLLKKLAVILGIPDNVQFIEKQYSGRYVRTPYAYRPQIRRKHVAPMHVAFGQGLLQLIDKARRSNIKTHERFTNDQID